MQRYPPQEAMQRARPSLRKVFRKASATYICHVMFLRKRRNSDGGVFAAQSVVEEDKVCEAATNSRLCALEGFKACLYSC
jgi:hypothetical protein